VANKYGKLINMYQEKTAGTKSAFTGKPNPGYPAYIPIQSSLGKPLELTALPETSTSLPSGTSLIASRGPSRIIGF